MAWPQDGRLVIRSLASEPDGRVELLGSKTAVKWTRAAEGLVIELPSERPCDYAYALRISPGVP
ncbi:MAG: alpha-L-fucosidase C-terminal domain-containing protein [Bryobacteraceae bacterium]